jgi:TonB family protein
MIPLNILISWLIPWSEQAFVLTVAAASAALALTHAKARLRMWQGLLLMLLLLPMIEPWRTPPLQADSLTVSAAGSLPVTAAVAVAPERRHWRQEDWLALIALGAGLRLLWIAAGFLRLRRYRMQSRTLPAPVPFSSPIVRWYASDSVPGPVTYGWRQPSILLPERVLELPHQLREAIACHELIHVRRGDWLFVLAEALVRSLLWFHPAIWFVLSRIQLAREQVVDQEAIGLLQNRESYLDALVAVAGYQLQPDLAPAPLFLRRRHLAARIAAVVKEVNMSRSRIAAGIAAVSSAVLIAAFAAMWMFPFISQAQTAPDSPGVTVDAGGTLLHRAPVRLPAGSSGTLTVQATLDAKGEVTDARVVSGPEELRKAALLSVFEWHYQPGPSQATITIRFGEGSAAVTAPAPGAGLGGGIGGGIGRGVGAGVGTSPATVQGGARSGGPAAGVATPGPSYTAQNPGTAMTLRAIEFSGLTPEAEQQIRALLPVREGDIISPNDRLNVRMALGEFDSHLTVNFVNSVVGGANDVTMRIAPLGTQIAPRSTVTDVSSPGAGVTNPVPTVHPEPQYSEEARKAKWQGAVLVSAVVDTTGTPTNIHVIRPLGLGLDEKAVEAVQQWKFRPGTKDGVPVPVQVQLEITFRLL